MRLSRDQKDGSSAVTKLRLKPPSESPHARTALFVTIPALTCVDVAVMRIPVEVADTDRLTAREGSRAVTEACGVRTRRAGGCFCPRPQPALLMVSLQKKVVPLFSPDFLRKRSTAPFRPLRQQSEQQWRSPHVKNHCAGEEPGQVGDRASDALRGEHMLPKRAPVGEG